MLRWRLLLGPFLIAAVAGLCWLDQRAATPGTWLVPLALLLGVLASQETLWLFAARQLRPAAWVVYVGNVLIVASNGGLVLWPDAPWGALGWPLLALGLAILLAFIAEMHRYQAPGASTERLALAILSLAYVGVLLSFVCQLRLLGAGGRIGLAALASLVIVVKTGDVGAYTVGRLIGRHKLAPILSPGKTIEGAIGAVVFAILGAWFAIDWLTPRIAGVAAGPVGGWLLFGVLVGLAGLLGDLAESLLKRDLGRKDSSGWLPGFGGVLDLLDSILFAAPVAYACWAWPLVTK
jgi:phosphatidate cytidylyltransferase